jgi:tRNA (guanine37-N1)-methyltransferase
MLTFDIITIFPKIFESYLKESFIKKAQEKKLIKINIHNLRDWASDKRRTVDPVKSRKAGLPKAKFNRVDPVKSRKAGLPKAKFNRVDDRPFGGGLGMVIKIGPVYRAIKEIKKKSRLRQGFGGQAKIILFTPRGKKFNQKLAYSLSRLNHLILICGRYEGVDERVAKHIVDLEISIGDYDLMGGDLAAMVMMETISRLIPGVLGKPQLLKERITKKKGFIEYPQYTRPEIFEAKKGTKWRVPKVLLSGNHKGINKWRKAHGRIIE